jgi:hypothetical protein
MTDNNSIDGTYSKADIEKLTWPIAWNGEPDREFEAQRAALVSKARDAFADPDTVSVRIEGGEVVECLAS